jgi:integrase
MSQTRLERGVYRRVLNGKTEYGSRCDEVDGRTVWMWGFPTQVQARHSYQARRQHVRQQRLTAGETLPTRATIPELIAVYLPTIEGKRASYRGIAQQLRWWAEYFKQQPVLTITSTQVERGMATLVRGGRQPSSANRYASALRRLMMKLVSPIQWVQELWRRVEFYDEPERVPIVLSVAQEERLYDYLAPQDALYARLAVLLGLRISQFFALRWEWLSWEEGFFRLPSFKRHPQRVLPIPREGVAILAVLWSQQGQPETGWVFPVQQQCFVKRNGQFVPLPEKTVRFEQHMNARNWYARNYRPAVRRAQLPAGVVFHTLRRTWASRIGAKAPSRILQILGGWRSSKVVERYCLPHDEAIRRAMEPEQVSEKVSRLLESQPELSHK